MCEVRGDHVHMCHCVFVRACVCMYVCVCERERERERKKIWSEANFCVFESIGGLMSVRSAAAI